MMHKTYQEAKINCPEACVCLDKTSGMFFVMPSREGTTLSEDCELAEAKDHCMSVKEFLGAGYRFEVGGFWLDYDGEVMSVKGLGIENVNRPHELDGERYILRAAVLEEKPRPEIHQDSEFYKKPRTKVEYVKVDNSIWHLESDFKAGHLFAFDGQDNYVQVETEGDFTLSHSADNLYRRIETPMTEREAFIEVLCELEAEYVKTTYGDESLFDFIADSGKFKLVN